MSKIYFDDFADKVEITNIAESVTNKHNAIRLYSKAIFQTSKIEYFIKHFDYKKSPGSFEPIITISTAPNLKAAIMVFNHMVDND
jgi:hypothetical protein